MLSYPRFAIAYKIVRGLPILLASLLLRDGLMAQNEEVDLTVSGDSGISRRMNVQLPDDREFAAFRESDFERMSVDDPRLQAVYVRLFTLAQGSDSAEWELEPHIQAAFNDLKRRGDTATPALLKLARDNPDTIFESLMLLKIDQISTMNLQPYVEYAREILDTRFASMRSSLASAAASLVLRKGDHADRERLERVLQKRPYLAYTIEKEIRLQEFRASKVRDSEARVRLNSAHSGPALLPHCTKEQPEKAVESVAFAERRSLASAWTLALAIGAAVAGVVWWLVRRSNASKAESD